MTSQQTITDDNGVYRDTLILKRYSDGGHITVVDEVPFDDYDVREVDYEVGKPDIPFPIDRDYCTITMYSAYYTGSGPFRGEAATYKVFEVAVSRADQPDEADRIELLLDRVRDLPELEDRLNDYGDFETLRENSDTVRRHNRLYKTVQNMWFKNSLKGYATRDMRPQEFEIEQIRHGAYIVPSLFLRSVNHRVGAALEDRDMGTYNVCWGGFLVEPENFTAVHELLAPFYHTVGDTR